MSSLLRKFSDWYIRKFLEGPIKNEASPKHMPEFIQSYKYFYVAQEQDVACSSLRVNMLSFGRLCHYDSETLIIIIRLPYINLVYLVKERTFILIVSSWLDLLTTTKRREGMLGAEVALLSFISNDIDVHYKYIRYLQLTHWQYISIDTWVSDHYDYFWCWLKWWSGRDLLRDSMI
jgi:hypothetical protein